MNIVAYANDWADEFRKDGAVGEAVGAGIRQRAEKTHPLYLGVITAVVYNERTDRYTVKFGSNSSLKISDEAAQFLLEHKAVIGQGTAPVPTVNVKMQEGVITGVLLLFLSRD